MTIHTDNLRSLVDRGQVYNPDALILELLDEIDLLRAGGGHAPTPASAGQPPAAFHQTHPIPDSTRRADP